MASSSKGRASSRKQSSAGKARVISTKRKDALPRTANVSADRPKPVVLPPIDALTEPPATAVAAPKKKAHSLPRAETTAGRKKTTRVAGRASAKPKRPAAMEAPQAAPAVVPETVEVAAPAPVAEQSPAAVVEAPALIAPAVEPAMVTAPEPVAETVDALEPPTAPYEEFAMTALEAPEVEALAPVGTEETELEVEASAIVEELPFEAVTAPSIASGPPPVPEETRAPTLARAAAESPTPAAPAPHHGKRALMTVASRLLSTFVRWTGVRR